MSRLIINNGLLIDPTNGVNQITHLLIENRRIKQLSNEPIKAQKGEQVIDASGLIVAPGLVDAQARMREPGHEHITTILSETKAAVAHGCTTLICPPDTQPIIDTAAAAELVVNRAIKANTAKVFASGALTSGLNGETLAEMHLLKEAGCVALSNADVPIINTKTLLHALMYAATIDLPIIMQPNEPWLNNGIANDDEIALRHGIPTVPEENELIGLYRLLKLIEKSGARVLIGPLSCARSLKLIREAKEDGLSIFAMTTIHHLMFTSMDSAGFNSVGRVMPPFRTQRDQQALREALKDGTIDIICSDHRPWRLDDYLLPYELAQHGNSGLDTFFSVALKLAQEIDMPLQDILQKITHNPANALELSAGRLGVGDKADVFIFDADSSWLVTEDKLLSQGKNNAFINWELPGIVHYTIKSGDLVYSRH